MVIGSNKYRDTVAEGRMLPHVKEILGMAATFAFVMFGRVLYCCPNIMEAMRFIGRVFTDFQFHLPTSGKKALVYVAFLVAVEWAQRRKSHGLEIAGNGVMRHRAARWAVYWLILAMIVVLAEGSEEFIYFQF